jgi:cytochrome c
LGLLRWLNISALEWWEVTMRWKLVSIFLLLGVAQPATAADPNRGQQIFGQACVACHSLEPGKNMTGPSLSGLWGRKAGSLQSFMRYSPALKAADVEWSEETLNPWLADPQAFIPGNHMIFSGIAEDDIRADVIAFLKEASEPGSQPAQSAPMQGMTGMGADVPNLQEASPGSQVKEIGYCGDTYTLTLADGETVQYWERNLRFKTDASEDGPLEGSPVVVGAGMVGDRASVIFAGPEEFGQFIKRGCPNAN